MAFDHLGRVGGHDGNGVTAANPQPLEPGAELAAPAEDISPGVAAVTMDNRLTVRVERGGATDQR